MHIWRNCVIEKFKIEFEIEITSSARQNGTKNQMTKISRAMC